MKNRDSLKKITVSAVFLCLAVVAKYITGIPIPLFGGNGLRVSLGGIFSAFPAILFGPWYGAAVSALLDYIGWLLKPDGPYNPLFTITAFIGGFIKGGIWWLLIKRQAGNIRKYLVGFLCLVMCIGAAFHIGLMADGVSGSFVATAERLITRYEISDREGELSIFSKIATGTSKYSKDTMTVISASVGGDIIIPSSVSSGDITCTVNAIADNTFDGLEITSITIPKSVKNISNNAFQGIEGFKIITEAEAAAITFAENKNIPYEVTELEKANETIDFATFTSKNYTFKSSDAYRKNLADVVNYLTIGLEATALFGLLFVAADIIISKFIKSKNKTNTGYVKIFLTIVSSSLIVTTINTWVLQKFVVPAWEGREFWILWIPRAMEEIIVCVVQAYFISFLYGIYETRIKKHV